MCRRWREDGRVEPVSLFDCTDAQTWGPSLDEAVNAINRGTLIVLPTDTVYGIGTDAFSASGVSALLAAKGRSRQSPPPVLVPDHRTLAALTINAPAAVTALTEKFWPGGLTIICQAQPALTWDLGETQGTVAVRMPDHPAALALLRRTGPLAVSSANLTGAAPAKTVAEAQAQLTDSVRSEEHTSELQSRGHLVCRPLLEKKNTQTGTPLESDI